jgi:predicted nucleotidyltransferase
LKTKVNLKTINNLKEFLVDFFKGKEVKLFLFGSRARGDNTIFSDIDIGILSDKDISKDIVILREILEESNIPYKVDIVELSKNRDLLDVVLKEGKRWL